MIPLNLPQTKLNLTRKDGQIYVFCPIRKKKLVLTPEEWVRQHIIAYLIEEIEISSGRIVSEFSLKYNGMSRRADIVVLNENGEPILIVECKRPTIQIDNSTFHQAAEYKHVLSAKALVLSNGLNHLVIDLITNENHDLLDYLKLMKL
jgi:hypothetical protein